MDASLHFSGGGGRKRRGDFSSLYRRQIDYLLSPPKASFRPAMKWTSRYFQELPFWLEEVFKLWVTRTSPMTLKLSVTGTSTPTAITAPQSVLSRPRSLYDTDMFC